MISNHRLFRASTTAVCLGITALTVLYPLPSIAQTGKNKPASKAKPPKSATPKQQPGGANQVTGMNGKIGEMLFDGRWRFQVQEVKEVDTYTLNVPGSEQDYSRYHSVATDDPTTHVFTPKPGNTLIAVKCLAKNGQNTVQQLDCYPPDLKTALTDLEGNSYAPIAYDMRSEGAWTSKKLLPGSSQTMTILFAVPPGTKLKDLVFALKNWSDKKVNNLRISLATPATTPAVTTP